MQTQLLLACFCIICSSLSIPASATQVAAHSKADCSLQVAIDAAMKLSHDRAPNIHNDALHAWKHFKKGSPQPHYSYRFWARSLILWMKKEKDIVFDSETKVAEVFKYLHDKGNISTDSVFVLTRDCWHYLVHLEGVPDWDKKAPKDSNSVNEAEA